MSEHASWRKALDAQMGTWRFMASDLGQSILAVKWRDAAKGLNSDIGDLLHRLYGGVDSTLLGADPIYVSAEMCELVEAASSRDIVPPFEPEPLYVTDLPVPNGFLYFDKPFDILDRFDRPVQLGAAAWQPIISIREGEERKSLDVEAIMREWAENSGDFDDSVTRLGGIAISLYEPIGDETRARAAEHGVMQVPPLDLMHVSPWYFGMEFAGNDFDENGLETGAGWWWRILQVSLRLMQQKIAAKHQWRSERHQRREMARIEFGERETLVVRLRKEKRDSEPGDSEPANYSHRFIVGGHWRNQWYPKSQEHRQIWISPYVKGDESLPLVVKPRRALVWTK